MIEDDAGVHPRHRLEELFYHPVRFSIMALLGASDEAEYSYICTTVEVSKSVLSKQVALLEAAGYVNVRKGYLGKRPRTWIRATANGTDQFGRHLAALRDIAGALGS